MSESTVDRELLRDCLAFLRSSAMHCDDREHTAWFDGLKHLILVIEQRLDHHEAAVNAQPQLLNVLDAAKKYDDAMRLSERFDCNHYEPPCKCGETAAKIDARVETAFSALRAALAKVT